MVGKGSKGVADRGPAASCAEIAALETVVAASLAMAERLNSEAASALLRRALALLQNSGCDAVDDVGVAARTFTPS